LARGPGRLAWNHKALISSRGGRGKRSPASSGGNAQGSLWPSGNPADASGAFRPDPRASTKVVKLLFQTAKLIHPIKKSRRTQGKWGFIYRGKISNTA